LGHEHQGQEGGELIMQTKNIFSLLIILFVTGCIVVPGGPPGHAKRQYHPAPAVVFHAEPHMVLMPGAAFYYAPDVDEDIYLDGGIWYLRVEGEWYSSNYYNGPWVYAAPEHIPPGLAKVPPGHLKGKGPAKSPPPGKVKKGKGRRK